MPELPAFTELAADPDPPLDLLALALAAEFHAVDAAAALAELDRLGEELAVALERRGPATPEVEALALGELLGGVHGFAGDAADYDHPDNSMLDVVLERRSGLPILLSAVYVEVARRASIPVFGVGLPGHFVVGHFGTRGAPLLLDPFGGGALVTAAAEASLAPWTAAETAMRMLNNLVAAHRRRGSLAAAIRAAAMRLALPADATTRSALRAELRAMQARLN